MDVDLTQAAADELIRMEKFRTDDQVIPFPDMGGRVAAGLVSADKHEWFFLDVYRGRVDLRKHTFQNRARNVVVLLRLDVGGALHRNPDGAEISCPHLHVYREGYADKWAQPVDAKAFPHVGDAWKTLCDFMSFCNVVNPPKFDRGLFT